MACYRRRHRARLRRTHAGDSVEFERLYLEHERELYDYLARRLDAATAESAAAEVFARAWQQYPTRATELDDRSWLLGIALAHLERHRGAEVKQLEHLSRSHPGHDVARALAELDPLDRDMLTLHVWLGVEHDSVAVMTGLPAATARRRIEQAYAFVERRAGAA
jgi:DNA-directed RNA polymerase specialized sigma24 family protein